MKIETSRVKKGTSEVPHDCQQLINRLKQCSRYELIDELTKIDAWTFGKCELYHWIDVLDKFDDILREATEIKKSNEFLLACDVTFTVKDIKVLLLILNFTSLLIEHSFSRHLYNSVEHLIRLLASSNLEIVSGVLNLLYMFSKRSNFISRLPSSKKHTLITRLTQFAESWGGKEHGFDLATVCKKNSVLPPSASTFYYEYYNNEGTLECIEIPNLDKTKKKPAQIAKDICDKIGNLDEDQRMHVFTRIRLATSFHHYPEYFPAPRLYFVNMRLQALSILVYSNSLQDNIHTLLYPGFLEELVELLEMKDPHLNKIRANALKTLTSIIHLDRNPHLPKKPGARLVQIIEVTGAASYHGFLPTLVRNCIQHLTANKQKPPSTMKKPTTRKDDLHQQQKQLQKLKLKPTSPKVAKKHHQQSPQQKQQQQQEQEQEQQQESDENTDPFPLTLATALFSFLYHLASYETGGEALVSCGIIESLLRVINWSGKTLEHITFVTRAVRVIDLITNIEMHSFQNYGGLNSFINRLDVEVNHCRREYPHELEPLTDFMNGESYYNPGTGSSSMLPSNIREDDSNVESDDTNMSIDEERTQPSISSTASAKGSASTSNTGGSVKQKTCLPQRAALLKSMLNFLKKAIQDPAFSDSIRHVMEGSLPSSLRHIISNAEYYGPSLFLLATDVVTVYVFQEPSLLSSLQDNGLTDVVLQALLRKEVPATREVLGSLPNVFSALCLNARGLASFVKYSPFDRLFKVLLSPAYLMAMRRRRSSDPIGDTATNLGNAMDELMRHQPSLKPEAIKGIIKLLLELVHLGHNPKYICWRATTKSDTSTLMQNSRGQHGNESSANDAGTAAGSSDEEDDDEEEASTSSHHNQRDDTTRHSQHRDASTSANGEQTTDEERVPIPLIDYILNVMKFVDAILSNNSTDDHCREFVAHNGLKPLLSILALPNLPVDSPITTSAQAVAAVCKSILNLAHEPQVLEVALDQLSEVVEKLKPLQVQIESPGGSVLLRELANCPNIDKAFSNAAYTPLLHAMSAVHGYVVMLVHICRTGQADIRNLLLLKWGQDTRSGKKLLTSLVKLYTALVWESTLLLSICTNDITPTNREFSREDIEKLPSEQYVTISGNAPTNVHHHFSIVPETSSNGNPVAPTVVIEQVNITAATPILLIHQERSQMDVDSEEKTTDESTNISGETKKKKDEKKDSPSPGQLRYIKALLGASSRLGRALAELFGNLVKLCVGSPTRQRRGQNYPTPAYTRAEAKFIARVLSYILVDGFSYDKLPPAPLPKMKLTFLICSVGFTGPMLFDEKRYAFHLMLEKFVEEGGLKAFFEMFYWAISNSHSIPIDEAIELKEFPDGSGEFLDAWLMLLEKMVNPKAILDSPHVINSRAQNNQGQNSSNRLKSEFDALLYLMNIHRHAFKAVTLIWRKAPLPQYGVRMTESVMTIFKHILKGEKIIKEKMKKQQKSQENTESLKHKDLTVSGSGGGGVGVGGVGSGGDSGNIEDGGNGSSSTSGTSGTSGSSDTREMSPVIVNQMHVEQLVDMGFPRDQANEALLHSSSLEQATEYLLSHPAPPPSSIDGSSSNNLMDVDVDMDEEQINRVIMMSLDNSSTNGAGAATESSSKQGMSANSSSATASTSDTAIPGPSSKRVRKSKYELTTKPAIPEEIFVEFSTNAISRCLTLMDQLPETTVKGTELLVILYRKNEDDLWRENMLHTLAAELKDCLGNIRQSFDIPQSDEHYANKVYYDMLGIRFQVRLHIFCQFLDEMYPDMRIPAVQALRRLNVIGDLVSCLRNYEYFGSIKDRACKSSVPAATQPQPSSSSSSSSNTIKSTNITNAETTSSGDATNSKTTATTTENKDPNNSTTSSNTTNSSTPKWLAQLILFLDLYEKVAVYTQRKAEMHKITTRTWKWYDIASCKWNSYSQVNNKIINNAYWSGEPLVRISCGRTRYTINFSCMSQVNEETGNHRPVILALKATENEPKPKPSESSFLIDGAASDNSESEVEIEVDFEEDGDGEGSGEAGGSNEHGDEDDDDEELDYSGLGLNDEDEDDEYVGEGRPKKSNTSNKTSKKTNETSSSTKNQTKFEKDFQIKFNGLEEYDTGELVACLVRLMSKIGDDRDVLHAIMKLLVRLTQSFENAAIFALEGGVRRLLSMRQHCGYIGFPTLSILLIRHVLEEPTTLALAMERVIAARTLHSIPPGYRDLVFLLRQMSSAVSRDPKLFREVAQSMLRVDISVLRRSPSFEDRRLLLKSVPEDKLIPTMEESVSVEVVKDLLNYLILPWDGGNPNSSPSSSEKNSSKNKNDKCENSDGNLSTDANMTEFTTILSTPSSSGTTAVDASGDNNDSGGNTTATAGASSVTPSVISIKDARCGWHIGPCMPQDQYDKPLLPKARILRFLADAVRSYQTIAPLITQHVYKAGDSPLITKDTTALSFMIDKLLPTPADQSLDRGISQTSRVLITALAACSEQTDVQASVVTEVKEAIERALLLPESAEKHSHLQLLTGLIPLMIDNCQFENSLMFKYNNLSRNSINDIFYTMVRKGLIQDLVKLIQYLDLSSPYTISTINAALKPLETLLRLTNQPSPMPLTKNRRTQSSTVRIDPIHQNVGNGSGRVIRASVTGNNGTNIILDTRRDDDDDEQANNTAEQNLRDNLQDIHSIDFVNGSSRGVSNQDDGDEANDIDVESAEDRRMTAAEVVAETRRSRVNLSQIMEQILERVESDRNTVDVPDLPIGDEDVVREEIIIDTSSESGETDSNGSDNDEREIDDEDENEEAEERSEIDVDEETRQFIEIYDHVYGRTISPDMMSNSYPVSNSSVVHLDNHNPMENTVDISMRNLGLGTVSVLFQARANIAGQSQPSGGTESGVARHGSSNTLADGDPSQITITSANVVEADNTTTNRENVAGPSESGNISASSSSSSGAIIASISPSSFIHRHHHLHHHILPRPVGNNIPNAGTISSIVGGSGASNDGNSTTNRTRTLNISVTVGVNRRNTNDGGSVSVEGGNSSQAIDAGPTPPRVVAFTRATYRPNTSASDNSSNNVRQRRYQLLSLNSRNTPMILQRLLGPGNSITQGNNTSNAQEFGVNDLHHNSNNGSGNNNTFRDATRVMLIDNIFSQDEGSSDFVDQAGFLFGRTLAATLSNTQNALHWWLEESKALGLESSSDTCLCVANSLIPELEMQKNLELSKIRIKKKKKQNDEDKTTNTNKSKTTEDSNTTEVNQTEEGDDNQVINGTNNRTDEQLSRSSESDDMQQEASGGSRRNLLRTFINCSSGLSELSNPELLATEDFEVELRNSILNERTEHHNINTNRTLDDTTEFVSDNEHSLQLMQDDEDNEEDNDGDGDGDEDEDVEVDDDDEVSNSSEDGEEEGIRTIPPEETYDLFLLSIGENPEQVLQHQEEQQRRQQLEQQDQQQPTSQSPQSSVSQQQQQQEESVSSLNTQEQYSSSSATQLNNEEVTKTTSQQRQQQEENIPITQGQTTTTTTTTTAANENSNNENINVNTQLSTASGSGSSIPTNTEPSSQETRLITPIPVGANEEIIENLDEFENLPYSIVMGSSSISLSPSSPAVHQPNITDEEIARAVLLPLPIDEEGEDDGDLDDILEILDVQSLAPTSQSSSNISSRRNEEQQSSTEVQAPSASSLPSINNQNRLNERQSEDDAAVPVMNQTSFSSTSTIIDEDVNQSNENATSSQQSNTDDTSTIGANNEASVNFQSIGDATNEQYHQEDNNLPPTGQQQQSQIDQLVQPEEQRRPQQQQQQQQQQSENNETIRNLLGDLEIPEGVDPSFLAALPQEMREEVISEHLRLQRIRQRAQQNALQAEHASVAEVNPEFLAALPPNIQEEVLAQQRIEQQRQAAATANPNDPVDAAAFFQNLQPSLRQAILTDMEDSQISVLPPDLAAEAQNLRRDWENRNRQIMQERLLNQAGNGQSIHPIRPLGYSFRGTNNRPRFNRHILRPRLPNLNVNTNPPDPNNPTLMALMEQEGEPLLNYEGLTTLLTLLFIDEPKLSSLRLHRVFRNLCFHVPTRKWIIKSLLSIIERCNDPKVSMPSSSSGTTKSVRPQWLNIRLNAALGSRANVFVIRKTTSNTVQKQKNRDHDMDDDSDGNITASALKNNEYTVSIHPQATQIVCKHALDLLITLAKSFPKNFVPFRNENYSSTIPPPSSSATTSAATTSAATTSAATTSAATTSAATTSAATTSAATTSAATTTTVTTSNNKSQANLETENTKKLGTVTDSSKNSGNNSVASVDKPGPSSSFSLASSSSSPPAEDDDDSNDFWNILIKLDCQAQKRKLSSSTSSINEKTTAESVQPSIFKIDNKQIVTFNESAFGQLLSMLSYDIVKKSTQLTDKLLRLLSFISAGLPNEKNNYEKKPSAADELKLSDLLDAVTSVAPSPSASPTTSNDNEIKNITSPSIDENPENVIDHGLLPHSEEQLRLAIDTLTSKSCSEEGLEDATVLLHNMCLCSNKTRGIVLNLMFNGVKELAKMVQKQIKDLMVELKELNRKEDGINSISVSSGEISPEQDASSSSLAGPSGAGGSGAAAASTSFGKGKGILQNRFTKENVIITAPTKVKQTCELQLPSMVPLISKTSSQGFFLRVLKVIIQTREVIQEFVKAGSPGIVPGPCDVKPLSEILQLDELWDTLSECLLELEETADSHAVLVLQPAVEAFFLVHATPSSKSETSRVTIVCSRTGARASIDVGPQETVASAIRNHFRTTGNSSNNAAGNNLSDPTENATTSGQQQTQQQQEQEQSSTEINGDVSMQQDDEDDDDDIDEDDDDEEDDDDNFMGASSQTSQNQESSSAKSDENKDQANSNNDDGINNSDKKKFLQFAEKHRTVLNQILRQTTIHLADGPFAVLVDHTRILDFDVKRRYFRTELERLDDGVRREELAVHVHRITVFEDSFRELYRRNPEEWKNRFYIVFEDEEGQDAGGLLREWYVIISREIFNPMYALFTVSPGDRVTYMINPSSHANPNHLCYYKFVGRVIAKAIYDNKLLECYFTRSFYKHILGIQVKYTDMESEDYDFYKGLVFLLENHISELGYELTFSLEVQEFGVTEVRDLIPEGRNIPVTEENKLDYIRLVCQLKMSGSIRQQLNAFLEGFYDIIPKRLISIFNEQELELLISGLPNVDIEDLKANTEYHKYQANSIQIQWFWRALRSFDQADRAKFLQFVTGTSKVPLQGFGALEGMNGTQKFQIHRDDRSTDRLPSAHTCFNQLDLPVYKTYDKLRSSLLKAIHECSEGFGFA